MMGNELGAISDAQQRKLTFDAFQIGIRGIPIANRERATAKNHAFDILANSWNLIERMDFALYIQFT